VSEKIRDSRFRERGPLKTKEAVSAVSVLFNDLDMYLLIPIYTRVLLLFT
jgi:hypothetical protein